MPSTHVRIAIHFPILLTQAQEDSLTTQLQSFRRSISPPPPQGTTYELQFTRENADRGADFGS